MRTACSFRFTDNFLGDKKSSDTFACVLTISIYRTYRECVALHTLRSVCTWILNGVKMMATPIQVANTFVKRFGEQSELSHMKLQKLVFFADGWKLGLRGCELVAERPQVWRYGPVFKSLYNVLTGYGNTPIRAPVVVNPFTGNAPAIDPDERDDDSRLIDWIWSKYGRYSAMDLSRDTHALGTPWYNMAAKYNFSVPLNLEIPNDVIKSYFRSLAAAEGSVTA